MESKKIKMNEQEYNEEAEEDEPLIRRRPTKGFAKDRQASAVNKFIMQEKTEHEE